MSQATAVTTGRPSLVSKMAARFGVDASKLLDTLKATAFKVKDGGVSNEQMMALLVVAEQYGLNPFTKEIYAFPDKQNGIVPVVGVDGWSRLINSHEAVNGVEFRYSEEVITSDRDEHKPCPAWCEAVIYRKDRDHPTVVREYFDEVYRPPFESTDRNGKSYRKDGPWQTHTKRMLRHKTLIQCARVGMGYVGIFDEDEAQRIVERDVTHVSEVVDQPRLRDQLRTKPPEVERPQNPVTFAEVSSMLHKAKTQDVRDQAATLIAEVADPQQQIELSQLYDQLSGVEDVEAEDK